MLMSLLILKNKKKKKNKNDPKYNLDYVTKELLETYRGEVTPEMTIQEGIKRMHQISHQATSCDSPSILFYLDADQALKD